MYEGTWFVSLVKIADAVWKVGAIAYTGSEGDPISDTEEYCNDNEVEEQNALDG